jgi:hypothetical protein
MEQKNSEVWKDAVGYEGFYRVSDHGRAMRMQGVRIKGYFNGKALFAQVKQSIISGHVRPDGYVVLSLWMDGKRSVEYLHRLIAKAFIENPEGKKTVNHIDGNPTNNTVTNLEWCTYSENHEHAFRVLNRKHSKHRLGRLGILDPQSMSVQQIKGGVVVNVFGSMREAERETGIRNNRISTVCSGKAKTAGGYEWKYLNQ